jgi:putative membrane protein
VLAKPELDELPVPAWLAQPLGRDLPFDVPNP